MNQSTQTTNPYTGKPLTENELQSIEHEIRMKSSKNWHTTPKKARA